MTESVIPLGGFVSELEGLDWSVVVRNEHREVLDQTFFLRENASFNQTEILVCNLHFDELTRLN